MFNREMISICKRTYVLYKYISRLLRLGGELHFLRPSYFSLLSFLMLLADAGELIERQGLGGAFNRVIPLLTV